MTGEAWLLVAAAAVAGYLLAKGGCGCESAHVTPRPTIAELAASLPCSGPRGTCADNSDVLIRGLAP